jgi:hypothetical protein
VIEGSDTFTPDGGSPITVAPLDGDKMVRLGGPFTSADQEQARDAYVLSQTYTVDAADPVLKLNYNVFLYDYQGFDRLNFRVRLTDRDGDTIADLTQGGFGAGEDISLKNTGWRSAYIDLADYAGQQVHLRIVSGGTRDNLYGFWAYVDAGQAAAPPVSPPTFDPPENVPFNLFADPVSGQSYLAIPTGVVGSFPGGCMPLDVSVPIDAGAGTVSGVSLLAVGETIAMTEGPAGVWSARIDCVESGDLAVQYTLAEGGDSETFIVPIGGIVLIDPAGVVYDIPRFNAARAAGQSEDQARASAAIQGATIRLQRSTGGVFRNVLSGDPGISPNVNPEITGANGQFQWDVSDGDYRVVVSKPGYVTATSRVATIPPEVTDLHVGLQPVNSPPTGGGGTPPAGLILTVPPPKVAAKACAGLKGSKLAKCKRKQKLDAAIAKCKKGKKGKRALCIKRAKALSKCSAITGPKKAKKKARCVAKARRIGKP